MEHKMTTLNNDSSNIDELRRLLRVPNLLSLQCTFVEIKCYSDFEGHGRASETWEEHWELTLPTIPAYWHSTKGWRLCEKTDPLGIDFINDSSIIDRKMSFHGKTFDNVVTNAIAFLKEIKDNNGQP